MRVYRSADRLVRSCRTRGQRSRARPRSATTATATVVNATERLLEKRRSYIDDTYSGLI